MSQYIQPDTRAFLRDFAAAETPDISEFSLEDARTGTAQFHALHGLPERQMHETRYFEIPGPAGPLRCRALIPSDAANLPLVMYFLHSTYSIETAEGLGGTPSVIAAEANCIVITPEHRLPPENPFPAAFDDCFAAYTWLLEHAAELGGDASRIAVLGESSAGTIAASICLQAKAANIAQPVMQILVEPLLDQLSETTSLQENDYLLDRAALDLGASYQFGNNELLKLDERASPLRAKDVSGLAPAYIIAAELDPLRDQAKAYAAKLRKASVLTTYLCFDGQIHAFFGMGRSNREGRIAVYQTAGALRVAFDQSGLDLTAGYDTMA